MVPAHVLIDGKDDSGVFAHLHNAAGFREAGAQRFLRQNSLQRTAGTERAADDVELAVGRHGNIQHAHIRMSNYVFDGVADGRDAVARSHVFGLRFRA